MQKIRRTNMKDHVRKARLIFRRIDASLFYSITVNDDGIRFQGHFNSKTALFLKNLKFAVSISPNGYIEFNRSNIKVTLT